MAAPNSTCCANAWCMRPEPGARTHQKRPRALNVGTHNGIAVSAEFTDMRALDISY